MTAGSALASSVTLDDVFTIVGSKKAPLAPELAGYLVLEVAEHADPSGGDVDPKNVFISDEGVVALIKPKREAPLGDPEASIRAMLARLLDASGSQTPALAAASRRKGEYGLGALQEELETALIPVNRAAGRRALARLAREVKRVTLGVGRNALPSSSDAAPLSRRPPTPPPPAPPHPTTPPPPAVLTPAPAPAPAPAPTPAPALALSLTPTPPPAELLTTPAPPTPTPSPPALPTPTAPMVSRPRAVPSAPRTNVDALVEQFGVSDTGEHTRELKAMAGLEPTPPPPQQIIASREDPADEAPLESLLAVGAEPVLHGARGAWRPATPTAGAPEVKSNHSLGIALVVVVVTAAAAAYAGWRWQPATLPGTVQPRAPQALVRPPAPAPAACEATLTVTDVPAHAEVLLRKGQVPVDITNMPVGTRLEFAATAEGYVPKRIVVAPGASWNAAAGREPRLEIAAQLERSSARADVNDPWPPAEPGSEVGGQGPPGTLHVTATPPGAEVWMLTGIGPEVRIDRLPCEQDFDVLVAGPTTFRKRLHVAAREIVPEDAPGGSPATTPKRAARLSAK